VVAPDALALALRVYLRSMSDGREPPLASPSEEAARGHPALADGDSEGAQRYGPLLLVRRTKEDGRALILFSVAPRSAEPST